MYYHLVPQTLPYVIFVCIKINKYQWCLNKSLICKSYVIVCYRLLKYSLHCSRGRSK